MTRRLVGAVLLAVFAVIAPFGLSSASAQTDAPIELQGIDASGFPLVRAVVNGPALTGELDDAFVVVEDGEEVTLDVVRLRANELNVVVALDVSGSMDGEPLAQAKAAVRDLLANLPVDVPVAIVSFGQSSVLTSDFTTERAATQEAVDSLIAAGGTALYDGVGRALSELGARGGTGALIVLADGSDSDSVSDPGQVLGALSGSGVAASFVALQTPDLDPATFQSLADASGGTVVPVENSGQLADTFAQVAAGLTGSYELRWTSQSVGTEGEVAIALASNRDAALSSTFAHAEVRQFVPDIADDIITSSGATGALSASWLPWAAALAVSAGAAVLVNGLRTSEAAVGRREERKASKEDHKASRRRAAGGMQDRLTDFSAHMLQAKNRGRSLDDTLDRAGLAMRSNEFVVVCLGVMLASFFVGVLLFGFPYFFVAGIVAVAGIPLFVRFKISRRRKHFTDQLGDTLQLMAGSLTAGYGLGQTLDSVARETESPTADEFQRVVMETRLGRSLEDSLDAMSRRIGAKDFDWVVDAIKIQATVGGNLSEIIQQVGETIRARTRIRRQVDALTAEGKISALVLFCLPFGLAGFIFMTNPTYMKPMLETGIGQIAIGLAAFMMASGGYWLKKLVTPEF